MIIKENYIKSPLNYTGGKYKLLPQILPLFPTNISTFVDLFGGGFNVGLNVNAEKIIYNEVLSPVVELLLYMKQQELTSQICDIERYINQYGLFQENKEGYLKLRNQYNHINQDPMIFYTLLCHAFHNQIRFNSRGEYNVPYGKRGFNPSLKKKYIKFVKALKEKKIEFLNYDFRSCLFSDDAFFYCDPPYLNAVATYNQYGSWSVQDEADLLEFLDSVDKRGKFALSNNLKYDNPLLCKWMLKYQIHFLNRDYSNCNYQKKDKGGDKEVFITNY